MTTNPSFIEAKKAEVRERFFKEFGFVQAVKNDESGNMYKGFGIFLDTLLESFLSEIEGRVVPEEPVLPSGREHYECEAGHYCRECMLLVAQRIAHEKGVKAFQHLRTGVETEV